MTPKEHLERDALKARVDELEAALADIRARKDNESFYVFGLAKYLHTKNIFDSEWKEFRVLTVDPVRDFIFCVSMESNIQDGDVVKFKARNIPCIEIDKGSVEFVRRGK